jgi:hypothetical protein
MLCANGTTGHVKCSRNCVVVTNAARGRTTRDFDLECRTDDGESVSINMSVMLPGQGSGSRDILHVFRDVTDRRRVENASLIPVRILHEPSVSRSRKRRSACLLRDTGCRR